MSSDLNYEEITSKPRKINPTFGVKKGEPQTPLLKLPVRTLSKERLARELRELGLRLR